MVWGATTSSKANATWGTKINGRRYKYIHRSYFAGFLEDVEISFDGEALAGYLMSKGVLLRPIAAEGTYRV